MEKLLDKIEILHKAVNMLISLEVVEENEINKIIDISLNKLIHNEQTNLRNAGMHYFQELDNQNK